jgi:hypothetical protein
MATRTHHTHAASLAGLAQPVPTAAGSALKRLPTLYLSSQAVAQRQQAALAASRAGRLHAHLPPVRRRRPATRDTQHASRSAVATPPHQPTSATSTRPPQQHARASVVCLCPAPSFAPFSA